MRHTRIGYTDTAHGVIAHLPVQIDGIDVMAPVKLGPRDLPRGQHAVTAFDRPLIARGRYLHALPGGSVCMGQLVSEARRESH